MFTGTLALVNRSLRVGSRTVMPHVLHFGLLSLTFMTLHVTVASSGILGAPGLRLFSSMVYLNFMFILLAGCGLFASAITEEKEEATLSLLQMAGINPLTLLLGKLVPRLVTALLLLAVQLPMVVLAITLGGVTRHQVFAAYVSLAAFVVLVAGIALLASVICRKTRTASILTGCAIGFVLLAPYMLADMVNELQREGFSVGALQWLIDLGKKAAIYTRLDTILRSTFSESAWWCTQVIANVLGGVAAFLVGWAIFPLFATDEKQSGSGFGSALGRTFAAYRPGRTWSAALAWKDFHFNAGGMIGLIVRMIAYPSILLFFYLLINFGSWDRATRLDQEDIGTTLMITAIIFTILELTNIAGRLFRDEVRLKTLPGLIMLPKNYVSHIVWPKLAGYLLALIPAVAYFALGAILAPYEFSDGVNDMFHDGDTMLGWSAALVQFCFFLHLAAYLSLFVKWGAVPLAFGITYVMFFFCMGMFAFLMTGGGASDGRVLLLFLILIGIVAIVALQYAMAGRLKELGAA